MKFKQNDMNIGIKDKNGVEVQIGNTIAIPYINPFGVMGEDEDRRELVVFAYGAFGIYTETRFVPLFELQTKREGDYIPNNGNKIEYTEQYYFWVV